MAAVVGRDRELETIDAFLELSADAPRILLIEGEAGIGKTTLWRFAVDDARARGYRVLSCAGAETETQLAYSGVRDLLDEVFDEVEGDLPAPQRDAMAVVLLREPPGTTPTREAIAVACLTTLRAVAVDAPTLLAIDDVQWLDSSSAAVLLFVLRRLDDPRIGVLVTERVGDRARGARLRLDRAVGEGCERLRVDALSIGALQRVLRGRGELALPRPALRRIHDACGGNPFYALEIAAALKAQGIPVEPGVPLPVPETLPELLLRRIDGVSTAGREALLASAAMAQPEIAAVEAVSSSAGVEDAIGAGILVAQGKRLAFTHPLLGEAVYARAAPRRRRAMHERLAGVVTDRVERGLHLALATDAPDAAVAETLERAAALARTRGALADAARLAEDAARCTPAEDADLRAQRVLAASDWWLDAGDSRRSAAFAEALIKELPPGTRRSDALAALGRTLADRSEAASLFERALAEAGEDPARRQEYLFRVSFTRLHTLELDVVRHRAREAMLAAKKGGEPGQIVTSMSLVGRLDTWVAGNPAGAETLRRALALEAQSGPIDAYQAPGMWLGWWHVAGDELDEARALLEEQYRRASADGDEHARGWLGYPLTELECRAGNYAAAQHYADAGYELGEAMESPYVLSALHYAHALIAVHTGDTDAAGAHAAASAAAAAEINSRMFSARHRVVFGLLATARGGYAEARSELERLYAMRAELGVDPDHFYCFWPDLVEALVYTGELERAASVVDEREQHERAAGRKAKHALLMRCRGLIAGARGSEEATTFLQEALRLHDQPPVPLERGRTLLALGSAQRRARQRRAARETLHEALAVFEHLGARIWASNAGAELARIGGRAPTASSLTPSEKRIATLVSEGKTNKEVAATLVVTERTVESALTQIYRKLGVRSRTELTRMFASNG